MRPALARGLLRRSNVSAQFALSAIGQVMASRIATLLRPSRLRKGQLVEVLSAAEIAATLDQDGTRDGLPFMPEMLAFCGRRMRVHRRADKTCVEGLGMRRLTNIVFIEEARCNGAAHDGCQRGCLMFWHEAWLRPVENGTGASSGPPRSATPAAAAITPTAAPDETHARLSRTLATRRGDRYVCQSTELARISAPMPRWDLTNFLTEMRHGELTVGQFLRIVVRTLIDRARVAVGKKPLETLTGDGSRRSRGDLGLVGGEWVEVKRPADIAVTLDRIGRNRGLTFEPDMIEFTGRRYRVATPVRRIIHEETGRMVELSNTVALEGVVCSGLCAKNCPRANPLFWREAWLERAEPTPTRAAARPTEAVPSPSDQPASAGNEAVAAKAAVAPRPAGHSGTAIRP